MTKKNKNKNGKKQGEQTSEDYYEIRKGNKSNGSKRKKDKKYLRDMLRGDIDKDAYHDYNDV